MMIQKGTQEMSSQAPMVYRQSGPGLLIRVIWFLLIGWWAGAMVSGLAWVLNCTIIGLPVGLWIINRLPSIITLRPQEQSLYVNARGRVTGIPQRSFLGRAIWFLLIGWGLDGPGLRVPADHPADPGLVLDVWPGRRGDNPLPVVVTASGAYPGTVHVTGEGPALRPCTPCADASVIGIGGASQRIGHVWFQKGADDMPLAIVGDGYRRDEVRGIVGTRRGNVDRKEPLVRPVTTQAGHCPASCPVRRPHRTRDQIPQ